MKIFRSVAELKAADLPPLVATIGNFDGIHLGHQQILAEISKLKAEYANSQTLLIVFNPQPQEYFGRKVAIITNIEQKIATLQKHQLVDNLLVLDFNPQLANQEASEFVKELCINAPIKEFLLGDDFRFGKQRKGSIHTFEDLAPTYGYKVKNLHTICLNNSDERVSSTLIRQMLAAGDILQANLYLKEPFHYNGIVESGKQLARTIKVPTANIKLHRSVSPLQGVYCCIVKIPGVSKELAGAMTDQATSQLSLKQAEQLGLASVFSADDPLYFGVCNIGHKPTVNDDDSVWDLEVHLLNFSADLYGKEIVVYPTFKLREEEKFPDFATLKTAIFKDVADAYAYFNLTPITPIGDSN